MSFPIKSFAFAALAATFSVTLAAGAFAADKPNILFIVSDDTGYGDLGPYGGGEGRGMPTPNIDRLAEDGMTFFSFYAQPSCTPGRAAMQTGRIPNRSGMTTVAFQGQGGGLPAAEWTLASVLKQAGYGTYFTGKWHLGEADYALPNAQGYDEMKYVGLYHLNAYTYGDPTWFPDMDPELRAMFQKVTKGALSGKAGEPAKEEFKVNGQYVDTPVIDGKEGVVGIPFFDSYVEKAAIEFLDTASKKPDQPFFINVNFMKVHQPNMPAPEFEHKSMSKSKYADSVVELDTRIGRIMDKLRADRHGQEHAGLLHDRQWRLAGRLSGCGLHPLPRHQGNRAGRRQPRSGHCGLARQGQAQQQEPRHRRRPRPDGNLRRSVAGLAALPDKDREGQPIIFDSIDMTPVLTGSGKSAAQELVLLHRRRTLARCPADRQLQVRLQSARRRRRFRPAASRSTAISAGRVPRSMWPRSRRCSISGPTRRSATTSS